MDSPNKVTDTDYAYFKVTDRLSLNGFETEISKQKYLTSSRQKKASTYIETLVL